MRCYVASGMTDPSDLPQWQRMTKRMRKLQEDMADDEAMGQLEVAKKKAYEEVGNSCLCRKADGRKLKT